MMQMRVIGVPRSGTNLVKYLIENGSSIRCYFNLGWWKHGIIPPLMEGTQFIHDETPTIITYRDPETQLASFFNYIQKGGGEMSQAPDLESFLAAPMKLHPDDSIQYLFASPVDYWCQFYHACLQWKHPAKFFIRLNELQEKPALISQLVRKHLPSCEITEVERPTGYLQRNVDLHISKVGAIQPGKDVHKERSVVTDLARSFSKEAKAAIRNGPAGEVFERLQALRFAG